LFPFASAVSVEKEALPKKTMTEISMLVQKYYILRQSPIWGAVQKFIQKGAHQRGKRSHKWEI
jgi:hypothetical protein